MSLSRALRILALESSADDTCAAIVRSDRRIISNVVLKQFHVHETYGGIHPAAAIIAHQRNMPHAIQRALSEANLDASQLDGIAFTRGPGIAGCLRVGANAAKTLAAALNKPCVGVHHMQAHALTPILTAPPSESSSESTADSSPTFPFLTLLVSGGHTLILLATSPTSYKILATTNDESIGRAFDKVSRMLQLKWTSLGPGAALEQFSAESIPAELQMEDIPRATFGHVMRGRLEFSYSAPHSTVERFLSAYPGGIDVLPHSARVLLARDFQAAAVAQLEDKLGLALGWCARRQITVRHLVVSGGVASNSFLRDRLKNFLERAADADEKPIQLCFPPPALCTDNAAMIAWASIPRFLAGDYDDFDIGVRPKWNIESIDETRQIEG